MFLIQLGTLNVQSTGHYYIQLRNLNGTATIRLLQIEKNSSLRRNNTKSVTKGWRELGKVKKASSNVVAWSNYFITWNICQCTILRYIILARRRAQKSDFERFASLSPFDCTTRLPLPSPKSSRVFVCLCFSDFIQKYPICEEFVFDISALWTQHLLSTVTGNYWKTGEIHSWKYSYSLKACETDPLHSGSDQSVSDCDSRLGLD